ncbi:MAG: SCO family protein [Gammaproteobacteria bacterium]|nr:SCO family protein [Gammaproteobacteria bacterium]
MPSTEEIKKQNQKIIILLVMSFAIPIIAAYVVFFNMGEVTKTRNYGELITPARPLETLNLQTLKGQDFGFEALKGKWHLVYIGKGQCNDICQERLSTMHQTRMGQGSAMSRVRLVYIALGGIDSAVANNLTKSYSRLSVLSAKGQDQNKTIKLFQSDANTMIRDDHLIFIIDPLGNLMMRYKKDVRLIGIIKDLEHLLKVSRIG